MKKLITTAAIIAAALLSPIANAAMMVYDSPSNPFTFTSSFGTLTLTYSGGAPVSQIGAGDQFPNQSYNNVGDTIESLFGLPGNTFSPESAVSGSGSTTYKGDISGSSETITSDIDYDYLSIHLGGYNVFFHFASLVSAGTDFNILVDASQNKGGGLSNYRAYDSGLSEVPIPAAAFMFAPALLGLMGFRRRNNKA